MTPPQNISRGDDPSVVRHTEVRPPNATVVAEGEIDFATVGALREAMVSCVDAGCTAITVDMKAVTFMDSAGLACLAQTLNAVGPGGMVTVSDPSPSVRRLLELSGMSTVLTVTESKPSGTAPP